jgi:hypothetical protein
VSHTLRFFSAVVLLAACASEPPPAAVSTPPPEAPKAAPAAPAPVAADVAPTAPETPAPPPGPPGSVAIPPARNGVLPAGAADKIMPAGSQPIVWLVDAGADPKRDLSYAMATGTTVKLAMSMDMTMRMKLGGPPRTVKLPEMSMVFSVLAVSKNPAGDWKVASKLTEIQVQAKDAQEQELAKAIRPELEPMKGLAMAYWVSPKGRVREVSVDIPKGVGSKMEQLLANMSNSVESMVAPLPNEPVGIGAKWRVITRTAGSGADLLQQATYTLKARDGTQVKLEAEFVQYAANEIVKTPAMPAQASPRIKLFESGGNANTLLDLKSGAPRSGLSVVKSSIDVGDGPGPQSQTVSIETETSIKFTRR